MVTTYQLETLDYIDCLLFEDKTGTYVQRDGKMYLYCGDMKLDCGLVEKMTTGPAPHGSNEMFTSVPNPEYGKEFKEFGEFVVLREGVSYGLVFRGTSVIRPLKFGELK